MLELELLFFSHPRFLEKGEYLPYIPTKRFPREGPAKLRGTPEHRDWLNGRTHQHIGGCQAQAEDIRELWIQAEGIRKGQLGRGHKSPPSFPQSHDGCKGESKLPRASEVP